MMAACRSSAAQFPDLVKCAARFTPQNVMARPHKLPDPNDPKTDTYLTLRRRRRSFVNYFRRSRALPKVEEAASEDTASIPLTRVCGI